MHTGAAPLSEITSRASHPSPEPISPKQFDETRPFVACEPGAPRFSGDYPVE